MSYVINNLIKGLDDLEKELLEECRKPKSISEEWLRDGVKDKEWSLLLKGTDRT